MLVLRTRIGSLLSSKIQDRDIKICEPHLLFDFDHLSVLKNVLILPIIATMLVLMMLPITPLPISSGASQIIVAIDFSTLLSSISAASTGDRVKVLPIEQNNQ